jgi:hypothetical protein
MSIDLSHNIFEYFFGDYFVKVIDSLYLIFIIKYEFKYKFINNDSKNISLNINLYYI